MFQSMNELGEYLRNSMDSIEKFRRDAASNNGLAAWVNSTIKLENKTIGYLTTLPAFSAGYGSKALRPGESSTHEAGVFMAKAAMMVTSGGHTKWTFNPYYGQHDAIDGLKPYFTRARENPDDPLAMYAPEHLEAFDRALAMSREYYSALALSGITVPDYLSYAMRSFATKNNSRLSPDQAEASLLLLKEYLREERGATEYGAMVAVVRATGGYNNCKLETSYAKYVRGTTSLETVMANLGMGRDARERILSRLGSVNELDRDSAVRVIIGAVILLAHAIPSTTAQVFAMNTTYGHKHAFDMVTEYRGAWPYHIVVPTNIMLGGVELITYAEDFLKNTDTQKLIAAVVARQKEKDRRGL